MRASSLFQAYSRTLLITTLIMTISNAHADTRIRTHTPLWYCAPQMIFGQCLPPVEEDKVSKHPTPHPVSPPPNLTQPDLTRTLCR